MSGDPSQVDSPTLKLSILRDLKEAATAMVMDDFSTSRRWLTEAQATINELLRREELKSRA